MICHVVELGDEAPIIDGLAAVKVTKEYRGTLRIEIWETRPHVLKINEAYVDSPCRILDVKIGDVLNLSLAPHLLKSASRNSSA